MEILVLKIEKKFKKWKMTQYLKSRIKVSLLFGILIYMTTSIKLSKNVFNIHFKFNSVELSDNEFKKLQLFFNETYIKSTKEEKNILHFVMSHYTTNDEEKLGDIRLKLVYNRIIKDIDPTLQNKIFINPDEFILRKEDFNDLNSKDEVYHGITIHIYKK